MAELPAVTVISLPGAAIRRAHMRAVLGAAGVPFRFFDALGGSDAPRFPEITYDGAAARFWFGRDLTANERGCYLSHYALARAIAEGPDPIGAIFEDDLAVEGDLAAVLAAIAALERPFDIIRLSGLRPRRADDLGPLVGRYHLARPLRPTFGLQGYVLSRAGARKILRYLARMKAQVDMAVDTYWENGLQMMAVLPYPVQEAKGLGGSIGKRQQERLRSPAHGALRLVARLRMHAANARARLAALGG